MTKDKTQEVRGGVRYFYSKREKADIQGERGVQSSGYVDPNDAETFLFNSGAIVPPLSMSDLSEWMQYSPSLARNIAAMAANVDGFGWRLRPTFDPDAEDAADKVREAIRIARYTEGDPLLSLDGDDVGAIIEPTDEEVEAKLAQLRRRAIREKFALETWLSSLAYDGTFTSLRKQMRSDVELTGNAYWEVLRSPKSGKPMKLRHLPSRYMRLCETIAAEVDVKERVRTSPIDWTTTSVKRQFRLFVEYIGDGTTIWFKEFGDPRVVSRNTGCVYADMDEFKAACGSGDRPATEVIHWRIWYSGSVYGIPRWAGTTPFVVGQRDAADVNSGYLKNKSIPPMAVLVAGGTLGADSVERVKRSFQKVKGKDHFHDVLVLEVTPTVGSDGSMSKASIELKPLTEALQRDAGFLEWDARCQEQVGGAFRIPPILRGETKDFNRATAQSALRFAEQQVFQAERAEFDDWFNKHMLVEQLGIQMWAFESLAPTTQDGEVLADMIDRFCRAGVLTPREARDMAEGVFGVQLAKIEADWPDQPLALTLAGFAPTPAAPEDGAAGAGTDIVSDAAAQAARDALAAEATARAGEQTQLDEYAREQAAAVSGDTGGEPTA